MENRIDINICDWNVTFKQLYWVLVSYQTRQLYITQTIFWIYEIYLYWETIDASIYSGSAIVSSHCMLSQVGCKYLYLNIDSIGIAAWQRWHINQTINKETT